MKKLFYGLGFVLTIIVSWISLQLYSKKLTQVEKKTRVVHQLNFLEEQLKKEHLGERMQDLFPEGFVFTNTLYGLAWCELALATKKDTQLHKKALQEALFSFNEINSTKATSTFDNHLTPQYGIYYLGWNNYLLSKILQLDTTFTGYETYRALFEKQCKVICNTVIEQKTPYLQSYENQCWPADMTVAIASISNHDKIFTPQYQEFISNWLMNVKQHLDSKTHLIPHKVSFHTNIVLDGSRGSSTSLIIRLLSEIDPLFAKQQYEYYQQDFVTTTFGLPSVREFPKGENREEDIDSGPILFGVGFAATIVAIGTHATLEDSSLATKQDKAIELFGISHTTDNKKEYLFGQLPIADAFIVWGRASSLNH